MAKYSKDHKPTGDAAKAATLPDGYEITGAIQGTGENARRVYKKGAEKAYAETKPSKADVDRLVEAGVIKLPEKR